MTRLKCRNGSKATFWALWPDVRYYPESDRDSDMPKGRFVPLTTKVLCSKIASITALRRPYAAGISWGTSAAKVLSSDEARRIAVQSPMPIVAGLRRVAICRGVDFDPLPAVDVSTLRRLLSANEWPRT